MQFTDDLANYVPDAIEMVSSWNLSDEEFFEAVRQQAQLMSGIEGYFNDTPYDLLEQLPLDLH